MNTLTQGPSPRPRHLSITYLVAAALFFTACGSSTDDDAATGDEPSIVETATTDEESPDTDVDPDSDDDEVELVGGVDVSLFFDGALAEEATTEECTLTDGTDTTCYRITVAGYPVSHDIGPFCPSTISDGDEAGGLWWDGESIYDLDGAFVAGLAELYGDDTWQMFDDAGNVHITETAEEFDLAARPDVDPALQNHCVEGRLEWLENGEPIPTTVLIPVQPVAADNPAAPQGNHGVTLDGIVIAQSAPVDAILSAYTIAAFDDCGGHVNPVDGYHMHGAVGCSELDSASEGETPMFGYAMDGYPIHSPLGDSATADLDECNGHATEADGYHYHANSAEQNQVITCLVGQTTATAGGGDRPDGPPPGDG